MTGGVDQIEGIDLPVLRLIVDRDSVGFDGDAAFPFQIHIVEHLIFHLPQADGIGFFQYAVGKSTLAVVNVGDNAEIANGFLWS